jgi:cell division GTPase FtsZ
LGVLPGKDEATLAQVNAGRSLKTLVGTADATILIDNDVWKSSAESLSEGYASINQEIARRFGLLLAAGEVTEGVGESVVDSSEVINTLRGGGMAAFGYHRLPAAEQASDNINTIMTATRSALRSSLSLSGEVTGDKALLVVAGEADRISRKGVEKSRRWVEDETGSMQVRGGDFPLQSDSLASLVLIGDIDASERVEQLLERAKEAAAAPTEPQEADKLFQNTDLDGLL